MWSTRLGAACCCLTLIACEKKNAPPAPGVGDAPPTEERITGTEHLGWNQRASDRVELATFRYAIYVDGRRNEATNVSCASAATSDGFACSAQLPTMSPAAHTL